MYHGRFITLSAGSTALSSTPGSADLSAAPRTSALSPARLNIAPGAVALLLYASSPSRALLHASALALLNVGIRASHLLASETLPSALAGPALETALTNSPERGFGARSALHPLPVSSRARRCCRPPLLDALPGPFAVRCRARRCRSLPVLS